MINDKLLPVIRAQAGQDLEELKQGQLMLVEGGQFDELYAGTAQGNSLLNPRAVIKSENAPNHIEGLEWIEVDGDGNPKFDFSWLSRDGKWVSAQAYEMKLNATSQGDMEVSNLIDTPYFGTGGVAPSFYLEELRLTIVSDVEAGEPMGHDRVSVAVGGLDVFNDQNAVLEQTAPNQMVGSSLRRSFDRGEIVTIADCPVFGLKARSAAGVDAFSSVAGAVAYRLVREQEAEVVLDAPAPQAAG